MDEVNRVLPVSARGKLGSLAGDFRIASRRVTTANTTLRVGRTPVVLSGWSDFDGGLDYSVNCRALGKTVTSLAGKLPPEARDLLSDLPLDDLEGLASLRITGSLDRLVVAPGDGGTLPGKTAARPPARRAEDRAKLKAAGKKLLERVIR